MNLRKRPAPPAKAPKKSEPASKKQKTTALVQAQLQTVVPTALKKKRKKPQDPSVTKGNLNKKTHSQKSPSNGKGLLYLRCISNKKVRTTFLVNGDVIETMFDPSVDINDLFSTIQKKLKEKIEGDKELTTHRKPTEIVEFNVNGSPVKVRVHSPSKQDNEEHPILERVASNNLTYLYMDQLDQNDLLPLSAFDMKENIDPQSAFFQSDIYKAIKQTPDKVKLISTTVTDASLEETKKEIKKLGGKRAMTQNQVMAEKGHKAGEASANKYVEITELFSFEAKWEWLHLIAHSILGTRSQDPKNLTAGTHPANTNMLFVELELAKLAKDYPQGFTLTAKAHKIPGTEIATLIEYTIKTPDFTLPFIFIAQDPNRPHIVFKDYIHKTIESIVEYAQENKNAKQASALPSASPGSNASPRISYLQKKNKANNLQPKTLFPTATTLKPKS